MKELNDYKEEIFRRSEEKKRQIKKRRRIAVGVGIPLCLCAVLTVAVVPRLHLGGMKGDFASNMEAVYDGELVEENGMQKMPVKAFRVTDPEDVDQVLALLDGGFVQKEENGDADQSLADQTEPMTYRLTLCLSDGSTLSYQVSGRYAYCETTGETRTLSPGQAQALYELVTR